MVFIVVVCCSLLFLGPSQADVTEDALDLIDEEIEEAERNIADRQQLADRCSRAEELEITNDAFYQCVKWCGVANYACMQPSILIAP